MNHLTIDFNSLFDAYNVMPIVFLLMGLIGIWTFGCIAVLLLVRGGK